MNLGELTPFHGCHDFKLFYASAIDDYDCEGEFKWTGRIRSDKEDHVLNPCPAYEALRQLLAHAGH